MLCSRLVGPFSRRHEMKKTPPFPPSRVSTSHKRRLFRLVASKFGRCFYCLGISGDGSWWPRLGLFLDSHR